MCWSSSSSIWSSLSHVNLLSFSWSSFFIHAEAELLAAFLLEATTKLGDANADGRLPLIEWAECEEHAYGVRYWQRANQLSKDMFLIFPVVFIEIPDRLGHDVSKLLVVVTAIEDVILKWI